MIEDKNAQPLVSVIIPSYNHEEYIIDCLKAVYEQDYINFEVIIRDDGSKDNSPSLIQSFLKDNENIFNNHTIVELGNNIGLIKSLNWLINKSLGNIIVICASDDIFLSQRISKAVEMHTKYSDIDLIAANAVVIGSNGDIIRPSFYNLSDKRFTNISDDIIIYKNIPYKEALRMGFGGFGMSFKRDLLKPLCYKLPESLSFEDGFLAFLAAIQNGIILMKSPLLKYRRSENSMSHVDIYSDKTIILAKEKKYLRMFLSFESNKLEYLRNELSANNEIMENSANAINFVRQRIVFLQIKLSVLENTQRRKLWIDLFRLLIRGVKNRESAKILFLCINRRVMLRFMLSEYKKRSVLLG